MCRRSAGSGVQRARWHGGIPGRGSVGSPRQNQCADYQTDSAMVAAQRHKPPDKQEICRKVSALLKKAYAGTPPKRELPVLETLLYAVCLENTPMAQADV